LKLADVKLTFDCNNRCLFCVQGDKRHECAAKSAESVRAMLEDAYYSGARDAVFTGGEPTLYPELLAVVSHAKKTGYRRIQIQTNGRMLCYESFCTRLIKAGARHFSVSLHGASPKVHDSLTRVPGSFSQTTRGIRLLKKLGASVGTNTVIVQTNVRALPSIAGLLVRLGVDRMQFAFPHILGGAAKNKAEVVPPIILAARNAMKGLERGIKAGTTVSVEAIPACLLPGFEKYMVEKRLGETIVFDSGFTLPRASYNRICEGKALGPRCRACRYFSTCEGPWKEYPELFGWDEFVPVE